MLTVCDDQNEVQIVRCGGNIIVEFRHHQVQIIPLNRTYIERRTYLEVAHIASVTYPA